MRKRSLWLVACAAAMVSCPSDREKFEPVVLHGSGTDEFGFDLSGVEVALPPLVLAVDADRTLGVPGQEFRLQARWILGPWDTGVSWDVPEGAEFAPHEGNGLTVRFGQPGTYLVAAEAQVGDATALAGVQLVVAPAEPPALGSLSGSRRVSLADAARLASFVAREVKLSKEEWDRADVDSSGSVDEADLALVRQAAAGRLPAPAALLPASTSALAAVQVLHPVLADPSLGFQVALDLEDESLLDGNCVASFPDRTAASRVVFRRPRPGALVFAVPAVYECLTGDAAARVVLEVSDGRRIELEDTLEIRALPSRVRSGLLLAAMGRLRQVYELLPQALEAYVDVFAFPEEDSRLLVGMAETVSQLYDQEYGRFHVAFQSLEPELQRRWDRLAAGMGLDEQALSDLESLRDELQVLAEAHRSKSLSTADAERLISLVCLFRQVADISDKVAKINGWISTGLKALGYLSWFFPPAKGAVEFLSNVSAIVEMLTGLIEQLAKFIPEFGDRIAVAVTPAEVSEGGQATVTASIKVKVASGLCNHVLGGAAGSFSDQLTELLQHQIAARIPFAGRAFKRIRFDRDKMNWALAKLYDVVGWLAGKLLDLTGIGEYMENLAAAFCESLSDPSLPLDPEFLQASCGGLEQGTWTCAEGCGGHPEPGEIAFSGTRDICGKEKEAAGAGLCRAAPPPECGNGTVEEGEDCEEDGDCGRADRPACNPRCQCVAKDVCGNGILEAGEDCEKDADCPEGSMCGGCTCLETVLTQGQCQSDADCPDEDPTDCFAYRCMVPPDGSAGQCQLVVLYGFPCGSDPCMEAECSLGGRCEVKGPKSCKTDEPQACLAGQGFCDQDTGECIYPLAEGADCASDLDCASGACTDCRCEGEPGNEPPTVELLVDPNPLVWGHEAVLTIRYRDPEGTDGYYILTLGDEVYGPTWVDDRPRGTIPSGGEASHRHLYWDSGQVTPRVLVMDGDGAAVEASADLSVEANYAAQVEVDTVSETLNEPQDCVTSWTYHWEGVYDLTYTDPDGDDGTYWVGAFICDCRPERGGACCLPDEYVLQDEATGPVADGETVRVTLRMDFAFPQCAGWDEEGYRKSIRVRFRVQDSVMGEGEHTALSTRVVNPTSCSCQ